MDDMLRAALRDIFGLLEQLAVNLLSKEVGEKWTTEFKKFMRGEPCWVSAAAAVVTELAKILRIDRAKPFDPGFIGAGWSLWRGPADCNGLEGKEEQDLRALALTEIDIAKILLETCLKDGESVITGEERAKRLIKSGKVRLDAAAFLFFWNNKLLIPKEWKKKDRIYFDGTVLRGSDGGRCAVCLSWGGNAWDWRVDWLGSDRDAGNPSAVLAK